MPGSRTVRFIIAADASQYSRVLSAVESAGGRLATSTSQVGQKVDQTTGKLQRHGQVGQQAFNTIDSAMIATHADLGPLSGAFSGLGAIWMQLDSQGSRVTRTLQGIGIAAIVVGGIITAQAASGQAAQANLQNAVENSGHSWDDWKGKLDAAANSAAHFGHNSTDATKALTALVAATGDPAKAIAALGLANDVAARTGGSLADAGRLVGQIYTGNFRVLRQFGINIKDIIDPQKELTKAQHDSAAANQSLANASQHLSDVRQRVAAAQQQAEVDYANAVQSAQSKVADSSQRLGDARQRLSDLEDQIHERTKLTVSDQYDQLHAADALLDVNQKIAAGLLTGQDAYTARRDAEERLAEVHAQQAEKQRMTLSETHQLRNAHTAVTRATEDHANAVEKLHGVRAAGPKPLSLGLQQEEAAAERAYAAAQSRVHHANAEMAKARKDMDAFPSKVAAAIAALDAKVHGAAERQANTFTGHLKGMLAGVENWLGHFGTKWGGALTVAGVGVELFASLAQVRAARAVGAMTAAATETVAVNAAADATIVAESAAAGEASSLALGPVGLALAAIGIAAYLLYKNWDKVWGAIKWAFDKVWGFLKRHWKEIIAFLVGGLGIYELYKHWDKVWGWIKNVAQDAVNFLIDIFNGLVKIVLAPINLIIDAVNFLIDALNHIHFKIPSWVPFIGGKSFGIHLGKIQHVEFSVGHVHFADSKPKNLSAGTSSSFTVPGTHTRAMAAGGYPRPGEVVKVGEHGEELAQFLAPVRIYPNGQSRGGDGASMMTLNLTVNVHGALTRDHAYQLGLATADGVHDGLLRKKREGNPQLGLA